MSDMLQMPKIKSMFAVLDVTRGRAALERSFKSRPGLRIPVTIHGFITGPNSHDDGTSVEFGMLVTTVDMPDEIVDPMPSLGARK